MLHNTSTHSKALLHAKNLCVGIDHRDIPVTLLANITLEFLPGRAYLLHGANGLGKTKLIKTLAGLNQPLSGEVTMYDSVHYLGHENALKNWPRMTDFVINTLRLFNPNALQKPNFRQEYQRALEALNLFKVKNTLIEKLSHGQQRKVALLLLWFQSAPLWLLDEPLNGLDKKSADYVCQQILHHIKQGGCVVFTHHTLSSRINWKQQDTHYLPALFQYAQSINLEQYLYAPTSGNER